MPPVAPPASAAASGPMAIKPMPGISVETDALRFTTTVDRGHT
jgi:hypothetical protein